MGTISRRAYAEMYGPTTGDRLRSADGTLLRVRAAVEEVSRASSADPRLLARAAYHPGNRHVLLQVGDGWLAYLHDHVLDGTVAGLGLGVTRDRARFEPEVGAYRGTHRHTHGDFTPTPFRQG